MPTIAALGTPNTKGAEIKFLADQIRAHGCDTLVVALGVPRSGRQTVGPYRIETQGSWSETSTSS